MSYLRHAHGSEWKLLQMRQLRKHERLLMGELRNGPGADEWSGC